MKRYAHIIPAIALALAACGKTDKQAADPAAMTPEVDVAQAIVDSVTLSKSYPGTITSQNTVDIVGRVNGTLTSQQYTGGDNVKKGQILFTIDDTQYRDALAQAQAALTNAESALEYASANYSAMQRAYESDAVAQIQVLEAKNNYEQAQAQVQNCKAALETARTNLSYCTIRAPFDGTASRGFLSPGAYVGGAAQPVKLATVYDNANLYAVFYIDDNAYARSFANPNNRHMINYDSVPVGFSEELPHKYFGKLKYIAPNVDTSTGTIMLRLALDSPYGELRNGMYCTVDLPYKHETHAVMVKDASISTSQTNKYLYVVNDSNRIVYTPIEVGDMANDSMRIVTSGLSGGERYVTRALLKVRPGMEIKPVLVK